MRTRYGPLLWVLLGACGTSQGGAATAGDSALSAGAPAAGTLSAGAGAGMGAGAAAGTLSTGAGAGAVAGMPTAGVANAAGTSSAGQPAGGEPATEADAAASSGVGGSAAPDAGEPPSECDRACLTDLMSAYLQAMIDGDASTLPLAATARFTQNGAELSLGEGLWEHSLSLGDYRQDFAEVPAGQAAAFVELNDSSGSVLLAIRLAVVAHNITEIETIVVRRGEAIFFSPEGLVADPILEQEATGGESREQLVEIADLYFQGLDSGDGSMVPFGSDASRNENGVVTARGSSLSNLRAFSYIEEIKRRYVLVDTERGIALPFALFEIPSGLGGARTLHLAEMFKIVDGEIVRILAIMVNQPLGTPSGWE